MCEEQPLCIANANIGSRNQKVELFGSIEKVFSHDKRLLTRLSSRESYAEGKHVELAGILREAFMNSHAPPMRGSHRRAANLWLHSHQKGGGSSSIKTLVNVRV
jgi:hypothetical protein